MVSKGHVFPSGIQIIRLIYQGFTSGRVGSCGNPVCLKSHRIANIDRESKQRHHLD